MTALFIYLKTRCLKNIVNASLDRLFYNQGQLQRGNTRLSSVHLFIQSFVLFLSVFRFRDTFIVTVIHVKNVLTSVKVFLSGHQGILSPSYGSVLAPSQYLNLCPLAVRFVGDSGAAILICSSLFVFPSRRPAVFCFRKRGKSFSVYFF